MTNKEALDQVRERIRRARELETESLANHAGIQEVKAAGEQRREDARREKEQREAAREQVRRAGREAEMQALKTELGNSYLGAGGDPEGYEKAWPSLRDREIERRTLSRAEKARQQSESYYQESF